MNKPLEPLKLNAVRLNDEIYINMRPEAATYYRFDDVAAEKSHHPEWSKLPNGVPTQITKLLPTEKINPRFELIDPNLANERIPLRFERSQVREYDPDEGYMWKTEYQHLQSLYTTVYDQLPERTIEQPFEWNLFYEASGEEPAPFSIEVQGLERDWKYHVTNRSIQRQLFDKIQTPEVALHMKPAKLSSHDTYNIVRAHVKAHLDPKQARISSDYNFCFEVQKQVQLVESETYTVDVNESLFSKRKRKPKYVERVRNRHHPGQKRGQISRHARIEACLPHLKNMILKA